MNKLKFRQLEIAAYKRIRSFFFSKLRWLKSGFNDKSIRLKSQITMIVLERKVSFKESFYDETCTYECGICEKVNLKWCWKATSDQLFESSESKSY